MASSSDPAILSVRKRAHDLVNLHVGDLFILTRLSLNMDMDWSVSTTRNGVNRKVGFSCLLVTLPITARNVQSAMSYETHFSLNVT